MMVGVLRFIKKIAYFLVFGKRLILKFAVIDCNLSF